MPVYEVLIDGKSEPLEFAKEPTDKDIDDAVRLFSKPRSNAIASGYEAFDPTKDDPNVAFAPSSPLGKPLSRKVQAISNGQKQVVESYADPRFAKPAKIEPGSLEAAMKQSASDTAAFIAKNGTADPQISSQIEAQNKPEVKPTDLVSSMKWIRDRVPGFDQNDPEYDAIKYRVQKVIGKKGASEKVLTQYVSYLRSKRTVPNSEEQDQEFYTDYGKLPTVEEKASAKAAQARETARLARTAQKNLYRNPLLETLGIDQRENVYGKPTDEEQAFADAHKKRYMQIYSLISPAHMQLQEARLAQIPAEIVGKIFGEGIKQQLNPIIKGIATAGGAGDHGEKAAKRAAKTIDTVASFLPYTIPNFGSWAFAADLMNMGITVAEKASDGNIEEAGKSAYEMVKSQLPNPFESGIETEERIVRLGIDALTSWMVIHAVRGRLAPKLMIQQMQKEWGFDAVSAERTWNAFAKGDKEALAAEMKSGFAERDARFGAEVDAKKAEAVQSGSGEVHPLVGAHSDKGLVVEVIGERASVLGPDGKIVEVAVGDLAPSIARMAQGTRETAEGLKLGRLLSEEGAGAEGFISEKAKTLDKKTAIDDTGVMKQQEDFNPLMNNVDTRESLIKLSSRDPRLDPFDDAFDQKLHDAVLAAFGEPGEKSAYQALERAQEEASYRNSSLDLGGKAQEAWEAFGEDLNEAMGKGRTGLARVFRHDPKQPRGRRWIPMGWAKTILASDLPEHIRFALDEFAGRWNNEAGYMGGKFADNYISFQKKGGDYGGPSPSRASEWQLQDQGGKAQQYLVSMVKAFMEEAGIPANRRQLKRILKEEAEAKGLTEQELKDAIEYWTRQPESRVADRSGAASENQANAGGRPDAIADDGPRRVRTGGKQSKQPKAADQKEPDPNSGRQLDWKGETHSLEGDIGLQYDSIKAAYLDRVKALKAEKSKVDDPAAKADIDTQIAVEKQSFTDQVDDLLLGQKRKNRSDAGIEPDLDAEFRAVTGMGRVRQASERMKARAESGQGLGAPAGSLLGAFSPALVKKIGADLADVVQIGRGLIEAGAIKFEDWAKQMAETIGDSIKPHLAEIWDHLHKAEEPAAKAEKPGKAGAVSLADQELTIGDRAFVVDRDGNVRSAKIMDVGDGRVLVEAADRDGKLVYEDSVPERMVFKFREDADAYVAEGKFNEPEDAFLDPQSQKAQWLADTYAETIVQMNVKQAGNALAKQFGPDIKPEAEAILKAAQRMHQNRMAGPRDDIPAKYQVAPRGKTDPISRLSEWVRRTFVNAAESANTATRELASAMGLNPKELKGTVLDAEQAVNRQSRVGGKAELFIEHGIRDEAGNKVAPGLVEIGKKIDDLGVDYALWTAYRFAIRDLALQNRRQPGTPGYLTPKQIAEAHAVVEYAKKSIGADKIGEIDSMFNQFADAQLDLYERYGLKPEGWAQKTRDNNPFYIPFVSERSPEAVMMRMINPTKGPTGDVEVVQALGQGKQLIDPLAAMAQETEGLIRAGEFSQAVAPIFAEIAKIPLLEHLVREAEPNINYARGVDPVITVRTGGKETTYIVDPGLWGALRGAMPVQMTEFQKFVQLFSKTFRAGTTQKNPFFAIAFNPLIDLSSAIVSHGLNPLRWFEGLRTAAGGMKDPIYQEWVMSLGRHESQGIRDYIEQVWQYDSTRRNKLWEIGDKALEAQGVNIVKIGKKAWDTILHAQDRTAQIFEEATRLAFYKQRRDYYFREGYSGGEAKRRAAQDSAELMNFGRPSQLGSWMSINGVPFANIAAQSWGSMAAGAGRNPKAFMARAILMLTVPKVLETLHYKDNEEYQRLAEYAKDRGYVFNIGDQWFVVPVPGELAALFMGVPRRMIAMGQGKKGVVDGMTEMATTVAKTLTPNVLPQYAKSITEGSIYANSGGGTWDVGFGRIVASAPRPSDQGQLLSQKQEEQAKKRFYIQIKQQTGNLFGTLGRDATAFLGYLFGQEDESYNPWTQPLKRYTAVPYDPNKKKEPFSFPEFGKGFKLK